MPAIHSQHLTKTTSKTDEFEAASSAAINAINEHISKLIKPTETDLVSIDCSTVVAGLENVKKLLNGETDRPMLMFVDHLKRQISSSIAPLDADQFDTAVWNVQYQFKKGFDFIDYCAAREDNRDFSLHRLSYFNPQNPLIKKIRGQEFEQSNSYYDSLIEKLPTLIELAIPGAKESEFWRTVLIKLYDAQITMFDFDKEIPKVSVTSAREKLQKVHELLPNESAEFYELCNNIEKEISGEGTQNVPLAVRLQNLEDYTTYDMPEALNFYNLVIGELLNKHNIKMENLCTALKQIGDYIDLDSPLETAIISLGETLEYQYYYQKTIASTGFIDASNFYYLAAILFERANKSEQAPQSDLLNVQKEEKMREYFSQLPKLALIIGGVDFQSEVVSRISEWENHIMVFKKLDELRGTINTTSTNSSLSHSNLPVGNSKIERNLRAENRIQDDPKILVRLGFTGELPTIPRGLLEECARTSGTVVLKFKTTVLDYQAKLNAALGRQRVKLGLHDIDDETLCTTNENAYWINVPNTVREDTIGLTKTKALDQVQGAQTSDPMDTVLMLGYYNLAVGKQMPGFANKWTFTNKPDTIIGSLTDGILILVDELYDEYGDSGVGLAPRLPLE